MSDIKKQSEVEKVVTVKGPHVDRINEMSDDLGFSARKIAAFTLAYTHELPSIIKTHRIVHPGETTFQTVTAMKSPTGKRKILNLFIPMTPEQAELASNTAKQLNYDFTAFFKMNFDIVYNDWKSGKLNMRKNALTRKYITKKSM